LFNIIAGFLITICSFSNIARQKCTNYKKIFVIIALAIIIPGKMIIFYMKIGTHSLYHV